MSDIWKSEVAAATMLQSASSAIVLFADEKDK